MLTYMLKEATKLAPSVKFIGYGQLAHIIVNGDGTVPEEFSKLAAAEVDNQKDPLEAIGLSLAVLETAAPSSETFTKTWKKFATNDGVFKDKVLASIKAEQALLWVDLVKKIIVSRKDKVGGSPLFFLFSSFIVGLLPFHHPPELDSAPLLATMGSEKEGAGRVGRTGQERGRHLCPVAGRHHLQ